MATDWADTRPIGLVSLQSPAQAPLAGVVDRGLLHQDTVEVQRIAQAAGKATRTPQETHWHLVDTMMTSLEHLSHHSPDYSLLLS